MIVHPVILCGGSGTRLWPVSRKAYPKQFAPLISDQSLYQMTLARFAAEGFAAPLVMTGDAFRFLATDQAADLGLRDARVVVEPVGRDTAPAILTAALMLEDTPDALMLVAPSDHVIGDVEAFRAAVLRGAEAARTGAFVTFGAAPDRPETGYGYLRTRRHARERRGGAAEKLPREARPSDRGGDACPGRLPVERGHLPDAGGRSDRRLRDPCARPGRPLPVRHRDGQDRSGLLPPRRRGLWAGPRDFLRLRHHGEGRAGDDRAASGRLVGSRLLGCAVAGGGSRRQRQCAEGGRARARLHRHLPAVRGRHDRDRGPGASGCGRRGDARRGPGGRQVPRPGREGGGRHAAQGARRPGRRLPALSPALGLVRDPVSGRSVPGEADHGQARR
jgi:hypothetical protein